jgi:hypothetical protein
VPPEGPPPADAAGRAGEVDVAALARLVAAQRRELDELRADVHALLGRVDQAFGRLGAELAALRAGPPPVEPGDAGTTATWAGLGAWVAWLHDRYPLDRRVPPCWWRHPAAVQELAALRAGWLAARGAAGGAGLDWHERLPVALERISRWLPAACLDGHHTDDPSPPAAIDDPTAYPDGAL